MKQAGEHKTINIQEIGNVGKYLVGRYDLEIPIYPLMLVEGCGDQAELYHHGGDTGIRDM